MTSQAALEPMPAAACALPYFLGHGGTGRTIVDYKKNQIVFSQGDVADSLFYILKGRIKLTVLSEQGKEAVVGILEPGQFFGEGCLFGAATRSTTTSPMQDCKVMAITKTAMLSALRDEPAMAEFFMSCLMARNLRIEQDLIDQLFNSSEKRLARLLLLLSHHSEDGSSAPIDITISQETLAEMIGTTRSRVSFFMNKFRRLGLVSYDGCIRVHSALLDAVLKDREPQPRDA